MVSLREEIEEINNMAILNGIASKLKGSVGQMTFRRQNGRTVVTEKSTDYTNVRSSAQQRHRLKWGNVVQMYKGIRPLLSSGFENKEDGVTDYNMFVKINMKRIPVFMTRDEVTQGACIVAPYQITQGSLPSIETSGSGIDLKTNISLGSLTINASTTVAEFSLAVVSNNADFNFGDQLSHFIIRQNTNSVLGVPTATFESRSVRLDKQSSVLLWDEAGQLGFTSTGGYLSHGSDSGDVMFAWVHSRKVAGKTLVSTQVLEGTNSILANYTGNEAYQRAVATYGGENNVFLDPDSHSGTSLADQGVTPAATNYTLTTAVNNASYGSVSGGGSYTAGSQATVTATANSGYKFSQWNDGTSANPKTVVMDGNKTVTATFVTDSTQGGGSQGGGDVIGG